MLTRANIQDIYPLTAFQHGLLFHDLLDQDQAQRAYFQQLLLRLHGALNVVAFETAWNAVIARHDILRTAFKATGAEQPLQIVLRQRPITLTLVDLSALTADERTAASDAFVHSDRRRGFRLGRDPLLRVACLKLDLEEWLVLWSFHHIIVDGWCTALLQAELAEAYAQAVTGNAPATGRRPGFGAYVRWLEANPQLRSTAYWVDYLRGGSVTTVPGVAAATTAPARIHYVQRHSFGAVVSQQLRELAQRERATLSVLLQVLWGLLLARLHDVDDVVFGVVTTTRPPALPQVGRIVGPFIATLPLRLRLRAGESCASLLQRAQIEMHIWLDHCHVGLGEIRAACGNSAAIEHFLVVENYPQTQRDQGAAEEFVAGIHITHATPHMPNSYPFSVAVFPDAEIAVEFSCDGRLIAPEAVERLWQRLELLAHTLVADATVEARRLAVVLPFETELLRRWSQGEIPLLAAASVAELRHAVIANHAAQPALEFPLPPFAKGGSIKPLEKEGQGGVLTHGELQQRAELLINILQQRGIGAGATIALAMPAGADFFIALLAGFISGITVVPVDPDAPAARNRHIIQDCGAAAVLTMESGQLSIVDGQLPVLEHTALLPSAAYVIYTSGTTGVPKGTRIGAASLLNYVGWLQQGLELQPSDRFLLVSSPAFDLAYTGILAALLLGGSLIIPSAASAKDAEQLIDLIVEQRVTVIKATPSFLHLLLGAANRERLREARTLRLLILGGEAQAFERLRRLRERCPWLRIFNHYGPTEATIGCIAGEIDAALLAAEDPPQRIGRPIAGAEIALTDRFHMPVAPGAVGEILVGGRCPALGYMPSARAAETRFVRPAAFDGRRFYRTGDYGRWLPDGALCFLGRRDDEVKIRGYRVDAAAVADTIRRISGQPTAVVVARGADQAPALVAFLAIADGQPFDVAAVQRALAELIPVYMLPSEWHCVAILPLTANGKIDREALLAQRIPRVAPPVNALPGTAQEELVRALFAAALGGVAVELDDDFFARGGHSLTAVTLVSALRRQTGSNFALANLFQQRTVRKVAAALAGAPQSTTLGTVLAAGAPTQRALFFPPTLGLSVVYRELAARLAPTWHCLGFDCPGVFDEQPLLPSFEALASRYADEISAAPADAPPLLIGWSLGGLLAWTTARLLEERGHTVRVVLLDTAVTTTSAITSAPIDSFAALMAGGGAGAALAQRLMTGLDADSCARLERVATHNDALAADFVVTGGLRGDVLCIEALHNNPPTGMAAVTRLTTGTVRVIGLECGHFELMTPPWLDAVAETVQAWDREKTS